MNLYMLNYKKQAYDGIRWNDMNDSRYTLYTIATNEAEACDKFSDSISKLNKHASIGTKYIADGYPKEIEAISVSENTRHTVVTGIWE